jgi:hypothetical protein
MDRHRIKIRERVDPGSIKKALLWEVGELPEGRAQAHSPSRPGRSSSALFMRPLHCEGRFPLEILSAVALP